MLRVPIESVFLACSIVAPAWSRVSQPVDCGGGSACVRGAKCRCSERCSGHVGIVSSAAVLGGGCGGKRTDCTSSQDLASAISLGGSEREGRTGSRRDRKQGWHRRALDPERRKAADRGDGQSGARTIERDDPL